MKNYQRLHYKEYYIQEGDNHIPCTRAECFAPGEPPTLDNPFKQRWYYAEDRSMTVRLERSEDGQKCYNANESSLKRIERQEEKYKGLMSIDRPLESEDGLPFGFEIPCGMDVEKIVLRIEELRILEDTLGALSGEYQHLWIMVIEKIRKKDIAEHFNINVDQLYQWEKKMRKIIGSNEALKNWFEKD